MDGTEILRMLRTSVADWNAWREANPHERPILAGVDLSSESLRDANLRSADLSRAVLRDADLTNADLRSADFTEADLANARLCETDLSYANFHYATVAGTDFTSAKLGGTLFADTDLSRAIGLEGCKHHLASSIDYQTLRNSWPLPEVFLRGCGLPDNYVEYLRAQFSVAIEFYSCFISYSSKDDELARRLHADLQAAGIRCWFAPEDLQIGDKFRTSLNEAIRLHDKLLLILSKNSVNSMWVQGEVEIALAKEETAKGRGEDRTVLFPIRLDSAPMEADAAWAASIRRTRHIGDFSNWKDHEAYRKAFARLVRDLTAGAVAETAESS